MIADVGGNLNIESLQDKDHYDSKQQNAGVSVSVCPPPCVSSVAGSVGQTKMNSDYASVIGQSGIKAGDGGFQVDVKGSTDLKETAFPTRDRELLNLRDLEQGLEQMKCVTSQDVSMQIVPAESDVVLGVKRGKPWTVVASIDNSGTRATGRLQGSLSIGIDNPLGLNDMFNIGVSQDLEFGDKRLGSHGWNGFYSIPWGYWTAALSAYTNTYYQQIAGVNQTFIASGNSKTIDFKLNRVLSRSQNDVFGAQFRLSRRFGQSFIEDTEIPQQRRNHNARSGFAFPTLRPDIACLRRYECT